MSHIFVSYSRKDINFAGKIVLALAEEKLDTWIDWKSIPKGEEWEQEIYRGIEGADAFLFLISPDSVRSRMCRKEIRHAVRNNKRIIPIVIHIADDKIPHDISKIKKPNWIYCQEGIDDFNTAIAQTVNTIHTDYKWLRFHNETQNKALEWKQNNYEPSYLLFSKELEETEITIAVNEDKDPAPTDLVNQYLAESRKAEDERIVERKKTMARLRNRALIIGGISIFAIVASILATVFGGQVGTSLANAEAEATRAEAEANARITAQANAEEQSGVAQAESTRVADAQATAQANATLASLNEQQASTQEILKLSEKLSKDAQNLIDTNYTWGLLLGVESFRLLESYNLSQGQYPESLSPLLDKMPRGLIRNLDLSSGTVRKILYAPNGNLMVSMNDTVDLWNTEDPASPTLVTGWDRPGTSQPSDVTFSPDSKLMVIGYQDGQVEIWNVNTSNVTNLTTLNEFSSPVKVSVSPANNVLAVAGDKTIKFWDISNSRSPQWKGDVDHPHEISDRRVDVNYLGFAPGSTAPLLLSGGMDSYLHLWNLGKYNYNPSEFVGNPFDFDTEIPHVALSEKFLIIADTKYIRVFLYSNSTRELADTIPYANVHQGAIENLVISSDNTKLYTTAQDGLIAEWDLTVPRDVKSIQTFRGRMNNIGSITFHPKRNFLAVGGSNSTVAIWNLDQLNTAHLWRSQILNDQAAITDVAYSPKLNLLALGDDKGGIVLWNVADSFSPNVRRPTSVRNPIRHIAFNPSDTALLILGGLTSDAYPPTAYRRDINRLDVSGNDYLFGTDTADIFAAGDNHIIAGESANRTTTLFHWDISRLAIIKDPNALGSTECPFRDTARNGSLVAVATCKVQLWNFPDDAAPSLVRELDSFDPRGVAFNADGTLLASANGNSSISIWSLPSKGEYKQIATIRAHANEVTSVAISPDGKTMASGGGDQTVILWDITDPENPSQPVVLNGHTSAILNGGIFFLADGNTLVSASKDEIILWDIDQQSWIEKACNLAGRNFTSSEWEQFIGRNIPYDATCPDLPVLKN